MACFRAALGALLGVRGAWGVWGWCMWLCVCGVIWHGGSDAAVVGPTLESGDFWEWKGVCGSGARAFLGGALGGYVGAGALSKVPDSRFDQPWLQACYRCGTILESAGVLFCGSCTARAVSGGLGGLRRVSLVCMHGAPGSGGL